MHRLNDSKKLVREEQTLDENGEVVKKFKKYVDVSSELTQRLSEDFLYRVKTDWRDFHKSNPPPSKRHKRFVTDAETYREAPEASVALKYCHTAINKSKCPINVARFSPEGRWLITGSQLGEFTLWSANDFAFNRIITAHEKAIRCMRWSNGGEFMITGDLDGTVKIWNPSIRMLSEKHRAHSGPVRGLRFAPLDTKFVTCADDLAIKIWDFETGKEERTLAGHGFDVKAVSWHPSKSLVVSGSRDNQCRLWNPRTGTCLRTLTGHKNTVSCVEFNPINDNWFVSTSRDQTIHLWDLRMMRDDDGTGKSLHSSYVHSWAAHSAEIYCASWHPVHPELLVSGGYDGSMNYWYVGGAESEPEKLASVPAAHEGAIWSLDWNPMGHVLASGSNDHTSKFWTRMDPGSGRRSFYKGYQRDTSEIDVLKGGVESVSEAASRALELTPDKVVERLEKTTIPGLDDPELGPETKPSFIVLPEPEFEFAALHYAGEGGGRGATDERELREGVGADRGGGHLHDRGGGGRRYERGGGDGDHRGERPAPRHAAGGTPTRTLAEIPGPRVRGRVTKWDLKGWGFIEPFDLKIPQSVFFHGNDIEQGYGGRFALGDVVEFTPSEEENKKSGQMQVKAKYVVHTSHLVGVNRNERRGGGGVGGRGGYGGGHAQQPPQHQRRFDDRREGHQQPQHRREERRYDDRRRDDRRRDDRPRDDRFRDDRHRDDRHRDDRRDDRRRDDGGRGSGSGGRRGASDVLSSLPADQVKVLRQLLDLGETPEVRTMLKQWNLTFGELRAALGGSGGGRR